jgi:hypothetical protein
MLYQGQSTEQHFNNNKNECWNNSVYFVLFLLKCCCVVRPWQDAYHKSSHFVHHKSQMTWLCANSDRRGGKPATNRLSYDTAFPES